MPADIHPAPSGESDPTAGLRPPSLEAPPRKRRRGCGGLFFCFLLVVGALWGACLGTFRWIVNDAKSTIATLEDFRPKIGSKVFSSDGVLLGEFSTEQRELVRLSEIPLYLQKAYIATEDDEFYHHKGVRPDAILNAALDILRTGRMRGGSTITQQVVRGIEPLGVGLERNIGRKIREAVIAYQIERDFTKDEILELYMNQSFLGVSAHGVQSAARQYFDKDCWDLTLGESALLAGLTRAPNRNEPFLHPENARIRRDIVLRQMLENGFITQEQHDAAIKESVDASVVTPEERTELVKKGQGVWNPNKFKAPYFVEEVRQTILSQTDTKEVFEEGLEIHTTLDWRIQCAAEKTLLTALDTFDAKRFEQLKKEGKENEFVPVTGALVCLDNRPGYKGYVRALVGGRNFDEEKFNNATQAKRQPGSSIKPFVWSVALSNGMTPSSIEVDEPYELIDHWGNRWAPKDFDGKYLGPITLRTALQKSINIVSVKLVERFGMPRVRTYLQRAGIRTPIDSVVGLTIALGSPDITVIDQCTAYSCFANGGVRYDPVFITQIKNRDGITLDRYQRKPMHEEEDPERRVMPANVAYVMTYLMEGVAKFGTGANTQGDWEKGAPGRVRAGKTGTSNEARNVWFCGFTPELTCVVWMGYKDNRPLGHGKDYTGGHLANPIWTEFMIKAHEGLPIHDFQVPEGVEFFSVDRATGLAGGSFQEAFVKGTKPPSEAPVFANQGESEEMNSRLLETL